MGKAIPPTDDEKIQPPVHSLIKKTNTSSKTSSTATQAISKAVPAARRVMALPRHVERLEDVFQDDIIQRFSTSDFKKFARSQHGLGLREYDIENASEDYRGQVEEMKIRLLFLWKQRNGRNATIERIKELADQFLHHLNS